MAKILQLHKKNKEGKSKIVGSIEIKNQTDTSAELCFFGDIISESWGEWQKYFPDDKCPSDVQNFLNEIKDVSRLDIHINSGGGSVFGGIAIYNLLKRCKAEKVVYIDGLAASIASVIAMAGDKIVIPSNAQMMIHKPSSAVRGNADDMRKEADILDGCQKTILNTYMQHTKEGITPDQINKLIDAETWKNGEEWQEFFDIEVAEENNAVAYDSEYFDKYVNLPKSFRQTSQNQLVNIDEIANRIAKRLTDRLNQKKIASILEDLDLI